jgi:hypothetical protein
LQTLQELFASGLVADIILGLMVVEGIALTLLYRAKRIGVEPRTLWINLAAGAALFLALRSALTGGDWQTTALFLIAGLIAHAADLAARWQK